MQSVTDTRRWSNTSAIRRAICAGFAIAGAVVALSCQTTPTGATPEPLGPCPTEDDMFFLAEVLPSDRALGPRDAELLEQTMGRIFNAVAHCRASEREG